MAHGASVAVFISQIVVLLLAGRLAGELMQRIGQAPVTGQIIAGVLLGPSILGALAPWAWHSLFPPAPEQHAMLDAVSQLGILLLLLITGMETDLAVFRDARRAAIWISLSGIVVPFACGCLLGALLPTSMLPTPSRRVIAALFLGTALSVSSVKIVALVVRDLGFLRRTVGQVIIASAVLDDTLGWVIISIIFGLALHGSVDLARVARTVIGTALFLFLSFTVGRRLVFRLVRWSNDSLTTEMATVTMILVVAGLMALLTEALGVHFVLGAFVAGILIGQSPILTRQLGAQLRGLIVALFMPVFFALAGLTTQLSALAQPRYLWLTAALIVFASLGKFLGAFLGGRLGGLTYAESLAVGCGVNARGSTEIIVASLGLEIGVLNLPLYTAIVAMAVVTTMAMPPMLRWAFARLPISPEEQTRLEREGLEARGFLPHIERLLVAVDASPSGSLASRLAGLLAGVRGMPTTVLQLDEPHGPTGSAAPAGHSDAAVRAAAAAGGRAAAATEKVEVTTRTEQHNETERAIATEVAKGYGLLIIGREPASLGGTFSTEITNSAAQSAGAFAIVIARSAQRHELNTVAQRCLVAVSGTRVARQGAELAVALAQASQGSVTAVHAEGPSERSSLWHQRLGRALVPRGSADAAVREIIELAELYAVPVSGKVLKSGSTQHAVLRELARGKYNLVVMGTSPRPGEQLFLGELAAQMLEHADCSLLFVCGESLPGSPAAR
jgi:K+:H+ antiporter